MLETEAKKIYQTVKAAKHVLLVPHQKPDGDALGASTAFAEWLTQEGIPYTLFCATAVSPKLQYLPHSEELTSDPEVWKNPVFDTIMVFDSGDLRYAGVADYVNNLPFKPTLINIDHHPTNERYGDTTLVLPTASSTSEIIHRFFKFNRIALNSNIATSLLTGVITDTDNFTNTATSSNALFSASKLVQQGGKFDFIKDKVYRTLSINALKLWGITFSRLQKHEPTNTIYTYLLLQDLQTFEVTEAEMEGIANFMNSLQEGKASLILKELPDGKFKGSFRTTHEDLDVSLIAQSLGGGGHKKAAGFTVEGPLQKAFETVLKKVHEMS